MENVILWKILYYFYVMGLSQVSRISLRGDGSADKSTIVAPGEDPGLFSQSPHSD